jgi:hypothetical protein
MTFQETLLRLSRDLGRRLLPRAMRGRINDAILSRRVQQRRQVIIRLLEHANLTGSSPFRVLLWEPGGMDNLLSVTATISTALRLRGAEVHLVMCDGALSGCVLRELRDGAPIAAWPQRCFRCAGGYRRAVEEFDLPYTGIGDYVEPRRRVELRALAHDLPLAEALTYRHAGVEAGRIAMSGAIRFLKGIPLEDYPDQELLLREYFYSSLVVTEAALGAIERLKPDCLLMSHDLYVDWGPAMSLGVMRGLPVVNISAAYVPLFFYLHTIRSLEQRDPHLMTAEGWQERLAHPLTQEEDDRLEAYLDARFATALAAEILNPMPLEKQEFFQRLPAAKPIWCLFAHVNWDEVFNFTPMAFDTVNDWLLASVKAMIDLPEVTWLVKIHPGEGMLFQNYSSMDMIHRHFPRLPEHIQLISPDAPLNPYELFPYLAGGITVCGTAGLELAVQGKPVILAGEAHYGGKGFTHDGFTREAYLPLLARAHRLPRLSSAAQAIARQYAYAYFIQRQIKLDFFTNGDRQQPIDFGRLDGLLPGRQPEIDMICARIREGGDFLLDDATIARVVDGLLASVHPKQG